MSISSSSPSLFASSSSSSFFVFLFFFFFPCLSFSFFFFLLFLFFFVWSEWNDVKEKVNVKEREGRRKMSFYQVSRETLRQIMMPKVSPYFNVIPFFSDFLLLILFFFFLALKYTELTRYWQSVICELRYSLMSKKKITESLHINSVSR